MRRLVIRCWFGCMYAKNVWKDSIHLRVYSFIHESKQDLSLAAFNYALEASRAQWDLFTSQVPQLILPSPNSTSRHHPNTYPLPCSLFPSESPLFLPRASHHPPSQIPPNKIRKKIRRKLRIQLQTTHITLLLIPHHQFPIPFLRIPCIFNT